MNDNTSNDINHISSNRNVHNSNTNISSNGNINQYRFSEVVVMI